MSRCTLCGGRLTLEGKCTECGLDNSKNDRKYRLNQHNEKGVRLHHGDCEDNLNEDRGRQKQKTQKAASYDRSSARSQSAETARMTGNERKKEQQRRETGTVKKKKKKGSCLGWIVLILALIGGLGEQADEIFYEIETFLNSTFSGAVPEPYEVDVRVEPVSEKTVKVQERTEVTAVDWDKDTEQFYTASLGPGVYTGGYDIPEGVYQLNCTEGNTWVFWWNPKAQEGGRATLCSEEEKLAYEEIAQEESSLSSYSEMFELEEGGILYVEMAAELTISGQKNSLQELKKRKAQGLEADVILDHTSGSTLIAGEDFEAGTYDVILENGDGVYMGIDRNGSSYYIGLGELETFGRFPFSDGTKIELELFGEDASVRLVPSY